MSQHISTYCNSFPKLLIGDYCIIATVSILVFFLFQSLWSASPANTLRVRVDNHIYGEFSLNQHKRLQIHGHTGNSIIEIQQGKVRFKQSPCTHQYCISQGWLSKANQIAVCLPNHISVELLGDTNKPFDTLNY